MPVFHVPGGFGTPAFLPELTRVLGTDQTHYSFFCPGIDGSQEPLGTIEEMANHFTTALQNAHPDGPFVLVGYCFGGYIAYEMARRLYASGRQPRLLALLECITYKGQANPQFTEEHRKSALFLILQELYGDKLSQLALPDQSGDTQQILTLAAAELRRRGIRQSDERLQGMLRVFETNVRATMRYQPGSYAGSFTLFRTLAKFPEVGWLDPHFVADMMLDATDFGWSRYCSGQIDIVRIPGNHLTMLQPPNFPVTASLLRQRIRSVTA